MVGSERQTSDTHKIFVSPEPCQAKSHKITAVMKAYSWEAIVFI